MSWKYTQARTYWCDEWPNNVPCGTKEFSPSGELPEGWTEAPPAYSIAPEYMRHRCPKHSQESAS